MSEELKPICNNPPSYRKGRAHVSTLTYHSGCAYYISCFCDEASCGSNEFASEEEAISAWKERGGNG